MKIIHQNGYTVEELSLYRLTIYKNVIDCAKSLIAAMRQFNVEPADPAITRYWDYLYDYQVDPDPHKFLEREVGTAIVAIYNDPSYAEVMEHQSEFYLMDSAP
jgi:guanine nucleotide-binding protein G(i) subunit alpha